MKIPPVYVMHHKSLLSIIHKTFLVYQNLGIVVQIALLGMWVFFIFTALKFHHPTHNDEAFTLYFVESRIKL